MIHEEIYVHGVQQILNTPPQHKVIFLYHEMQPKVVQRDNVIYTRTCDKYRPKLVLKVGRTNNTKRRNDEYQKKYNINTEYWCMSSRKFTPQHAGKIEKQLIAKCKELGGRPYNANKNPKPDREWFEFGNSSTFLNAINELTKFILLL